MKYKGTELKEFSSETPVVFDPPKKMLAWDNGIIDTPRLTLATAYIPGRFYPVIGASTVYRHCAEIPEEPKPRRATYFELAKWLAQGNGLCKHYCGAEVWTYTECDEDELENECNPDWHVRKWEDKEWHEPTADYIGLEG